MGLSTCYCVAMTSEPRPSWLTVKDVADELSIAPMTVYRLLNSGELPCLRLGTRNIRISRASLDAYIRHQQGLPPLPAAAPEPARFDPVEAYIDAKTNDEEVEDFLRPEDPPDVAAANHLHRVLQSRGYGVPAWILGEALKETESLLELDRLHAEREAAEAPNE